MTKEFIYNYQNHKQNDIDNITKKKYIINDLLNNIHTVFNTEKKFIMQKCNYGDYQCKNPSCSFLHLDDKEIKKIFEKNQSNFYQSRNKYLLDEFNSGNIKFINESYYTLNNLKILLNKCKFNKKCNNIHCTFKHDTDESIINQLSNIYQKNKITNLQVKEETIIIIPSNIQDKQELEKKHQKDGWDNESDNEFETTLDEYKDESIINLEHNNDESDNESKINLEKNKDESDNESETMLDNDKDESKINLEQNNNESNNYSDIQTQFGDDIESSNTAQSSNTYNTFYTPYYVTQVLPNHIDMQNQYINTLHTKITELEKNISSNNKLFEQQSIIFQTIIQQNLEIKSLKEEILSLKEKK